MQILKHVHRWMAPPSARLVRLRQAAQVVMRHVGLAGQCKAMFTTDTDGSIGAVLLITTPQHVPHQDRPELQLYFQRKLAAMGGVDGQSLLVMLRDADDLRQANRLRAEVSSVRVASVIAAANPSRQDTRRNALEAMRTQVRERLHARREEREASAFVPMVRPALTDLAELSEQVEFSGTSKRIAARA